MSVAERVRRAGRWTAGPSRRLAMAVAVQQLLPTALLPIVVLLYPAAEVGHYQVALSIAIVAQVVATAGYEYVIPGIVDPVRARSATRRASLLLTAVVVIAVVAIWPVAVLFGGEGATAWTLAVAIMAASAVTALDNARLMRLGDHRTLIRRNLVSGVVVVVVQLGAAPFLPTAAALVGGLAMGRVCSLVIRSDPSERGREVAGERNDRRFSPDRPGAAWTIAVLLSTATLQLPIVVGGWVLGAEDAAQLALAVRFASAPASLVGAGIAQGLLFAVAQRTRTGTAGLHPVLRRTQLRLAVLGVVCGIALTALGPVAITLALGPEWRGAAIALAVLALPSSLQIVNRATTPLFPAMGATGRLLLAQAVRAAGTAALLALAVAFLGAGVIPVAVAMAISGVAFQFVFTVVTDRAARRAFA